MQMQTKCKQDANNICLYFALVLLVLHAKTKKDETNTDSIGCLSADWVLFQ